MLHPPITLVAAILLSFSVLPIYQAASPVNANATPEARNLLEFVSSARGHYLITAQHNFAGTGSRYTNLVKAITGRSPLIWGSDFSFCYEGSEPQKFQHCGPMNLTSPGDPLYYLKVTADQVRSTVVQTAIKEHAAGHIITMMWHAAPPGLGDDCDGKAIWTLDRRPSEASWKDLTTEGTPMNLAWRSKMGVIADYLAQLQTAGVPVLWRPFHEMNGVWFWWGAKKGPEGFRRIWVMMYNYFVHERGLNNLIWVWDTNAPRNRLGDEAYDYKEFWPGSEYVDIMAADIYRSDWKKSHETDLQALAPDKPIAMGEVGEPPSPELISQQPSWTWFMPWPFAAISGKNPDRLRLIYSDSRALTLEDISVGPNGRYTVSKKP